MKAYLEKNMRYRKTLWVLGLFLTQLLVAQTTAGGSQFCPKGDFAGGMKGWSTSGDAASGHVVATPGGPCAQAFELRAVSGPAWLRSDLFPVQPLSRYSFSAMVHRISGEAGYTLSVIWCDQPGNRLGCEYFLMGALIGTGWEPYRIEAIAPEKATHAMVEVVLPSGWACQVTRFELTEIDPGAPSLSIDILSEPVSTQGLYPLKVRIENRGTQVLEKIQGVLTLPSGVTCDGTNELRSDRLSFGESQVHQINLRGLPAGQGDEVLCEVKTISGGQPITFRQTTHLFTTVPQEVEIETGQLPPPSLPPMDLKLGCYYFPVMLDWIRNGWGVRSVDYLKPRLGYYDETSPEVADWHIYWAVEHGISYFVFDWYFNQGFNYLNDALEQGFMKSRFIDKVQFCVDWCNEGHCGQFKPVDFDDESLRQFMVTLCERYFGHPSYLRVDGKPVVFIHMPVKLANAHGGWEGCKTALDKMRETARSYGHPGVYFVAVQNNTPYLWEVQRGGFDCLTAYAYGFRDVAWDPSTRSLPYEQTIPRHHECFQIALENAKKQGIDYIPSAWVGWDDAARSNTNAVRSVGNTPGAFRRMLEMLPESTGTRDRLALFESWNEWGEGGQAEPEKGFNGYGRLAAVRDVLTRSRGPYRIMAPTTAEVARFDTPITFDEVNAHYYRRYAHELGLGEGLHLEFEGIHDLCLVPNGIEDFRIEEGQLKGQSRTGDPGLLGPPGMGLPSTKVSSITIRMALTGGTKGQVFWRGGETEGWTEERSLTFPVEADGDMHTYTLEVLKSPSWEGNIYQVRFDPADAPSEISVDFFRTETEGGR